MKKNFDVDHSQEKSETKLTYKNIMDLANSDEIIVADVRRMTNSPEEGYATGKIEGLITLDEKHGLNFNCIGRAEWFQITPQLIDDGDVIFSKK